MSSLLALQTKDAIIFASDTALSAKVKGKSYRVANNESKLFEYDNFIMFASGKKHLRDLFISSLSSTPTISEIQFVLDNYISRYSEEFSLEVVIAMKDLSKLIFFSSTDGFEYSENVANEYTNLFTAGYKTNEISHKFEEYYQNDMLIKALQLTYKDVNCAEIGGNLDVMILEKEKVRSYQFPVDNSQTNSLEELSELLNLVHAEKLVGRVILSTKLWVEDELGVVSIQSGLQTIYDNYGVPRVFLGRYPTHDSPNVFDYGLRIDNGSFSIRTSSSDKRGVQIDGQGIRGYNNNGVKTFDLDTSGHVSIIGSMTIKSSTSSNKGVVIDGDGIRGYNGSGTLMFEINNNGNAWFGGRLESATGTVNNLGGTINNMGGSFVGSINSDGVFKGVTTGSLSAQTVNAINIKAEQITSGKISSNLIDANSLTAATIDVDQLTANGIKVNSLSSISSDLGNITGGNITIDTDMTIGNNLYIGTHWQNQEKSIIFGGSAMGGARIDYTRDQIVLSAMAGVVCDPILKVNGILDLTGATVIGL